LKRKIIF